MRSRLAAGAMDFGDDGGGAPLPRRGGGGGGGTGSPPRGALAGVRADHERAKLARATGQTLKKSGSAWSNGAQHVACLCQLSALTNPTAASSLSAAFLNGKSWHPMNYKNQKAVWVAEQAAAARAAADAQAKEEFASEQEFFKCAVRRCCAACALLTPAAHAPRRAGTWRRCPARSSAS